MLPFDDVGNLKCYELFRWFSKNSAIKSILQTEEIKLFNKKTGGYLGYDCNVGNKTNTQNYITKYKNIKEVYNNIINNTETNQDMLYHKLDNLVILYDKNIKDFVNLSNSYDAYNTKYNFYNSKIHTIFDIIQVDNNYNYSSDILDFIKNYINYDSCDFLNIEYKEKYLKYKKKYIELKNNKKISF